MGHWLRLRGRRGRVEGAGEGRQEGRWGSFGWRKRKGAGVKRRGRGNVRSVRGEWQQDLFNLAGEAASIVPLATVAGAGMRGVTAGEEIVFERSLRAKNYRLTLRRDGVAVATIPARGTEREARAFVAQQEAWLQRARARQKARPRLPEVWTLGTHVLWRGEMTAIRAVEKGARPQVALGADVFRAARLDGNLRPTLEAHFQRVAWVELPARTWELAAVTGVATKQVTVRNQRTRWGSCTTGGVISLNWRLVQTPERVRDYIIYHELMHLREMNHSARFWARVGEVCPGWREAEKWLAGHGSLLGL